MNAEQRAQHAQVEVWGLHGRHCSSAGGGTVELPGVQLMSSGLPYPRWNSGDVFEPERVDVEAVRAWYAAAAFGRGVGWGLRVIAGTPWSRGRFLFRKRLMALDAAAFRPAPAPAGVSLRPATKADLDVVAAIDGSAFENPAAESRAWLAHQLGTSGFTTAIAAIGDDVVGIASSVRTKGRGGNCAGIYGVAVLERARRRGIGAAVTSWLLERDFADGASLAHLNPDQDEAGRIYARLGFAEVNGFDIYVEL